MVDILRKILLLAYCLLVPYNKSIVVTIYVLIRVVVP